MLKGEIEVYNNSNPDYEILFEDVRNGLNFSPDEKKVIIKSSIEKAKTFSLY